MTEPRRNISALTREVATLTADIERLRTDLRNVFDRFLTAHRAAKVDGPR